MDFVVGFIILVILGSAASHVKKQLKSGSPCMGCSGNCHSGCGEASPSEEDGTSL